MRTSAAVAIAILWAGASTTSAATSLSPAEELGRVIYASGVDRSGRPIAARVAGAATALAGSPVACANCHGEDGRGRAESGVDPGDVNWSVLAKPYGHAHANGRRHGPYDARSLARALRQGVDPAGNVLAPAMPRYALSDGDIDALAAYLARIDATRHPGIGDTSIRVGTLLPASGRFAAAGDAVRDVLARYFDQLNRNGGVHGRRVELVIEARTDDDESDILAMNRLIADDDVFALVAPLSARIEHRLAEAADAAQIAVVGPLTLYPEDSRASSANVFHLLPGVAELAEVLAVHSIPTLGLSGRRVALLCADDDEGRAIADRVEARFRERGYGALIRVPLAKRSTPSTLATRLVDADAAGIVVLANDASLSDVARVLARRETTVQWLFPAPLVPRDLLDWPAAYQGRIAIAYPTLPGDRTPSAALEFDALTKHDGTPRAFRALQAQAYSAASVLVEALSRGGRDLSRRKLVAALEGLHNFEPGLVPPITYNADRRIGSLGGYAVAVDLAARDFRPVGGFVRLQ